MSATSILRHTGGFTATNGYLFPAREGAVVIDAPAGMADWLRKGGHQPAALFLTHCHFDHVTDAARIAEEYGCPVAAWGPSTPAGRLEHLLASFLGRAAEVKEYPVHLTLDGRDSVELAGSTFLLRHVPGHSPDSVVLIAEAAEAIFAGDTVMDGGIGRTDFPGGDYDVLVEGIREKILTLPPGFRIYPGHGEVSTVAEERAGNAWLR
jgi:hydroxyacylglutathione hydrolase